MAKVTGDVGQAGLDELRVALVAPKGARLQSLRQALTAHAPHWQLDCFTDPQWALAALPALHPAPAAVLMDIGMPGLDGIESLQRLRALMPNLPVLAFTARSKPARVVRSLAAGARGYRIKPVPPPERVTPIGAAAQTPSSLGAEAQAGPMQLLQRVGTTGKANRLSPREREVMLCVQKGLSNPAAAGSLGISEATLGRHLATIYKKLSVHKREDALRVFGGR